jgi:transcriptional regulator GlxA family with amidase domain
LDRVLPVMAYIREHLAEPLPLDKLAGSLYMNKYHLCRVFKAATGLSVVDYIINCRIIRARELLRQGMRVQDAGEQAGFQNNVHFIRTFGKLTGTSPKRYARKYLTGATD